MVFCSKVFTPIESGQLRRSFRLALRRAKIEDFHFHDLRHTFATRLVQAGVDLYKIQRLLGHQSPNMTQRFAHHYPESLRDGVEVLDRLAGVSTKLAHVLTVPVLAGSPTGTDLSTGPPSRVDRDGGASWNYLH